MKDGKMTFFRVNETFPMEGESVFVLTDLGSIRYCRVIRHPGGAPIFMSVDCWVELPNIKWYSYGGCFLVDEDEGQVVC